jgi:alpha-L-fucosidase
MIVIAEPEENIKRYTLSYWNGTTWKQFFSGTNVDKIKLHRFDPLWGSKVRMEILESAKPAEISEFQVYQERAFEQAQSKG